MLKPFGTPKWILKGDKKIQRRYLQRLFDCEGSIQLQKIKRIMIKLKFHKIAHLKGNMINFLNEIRSMLLRFYIRSTNPFKAGQTKRKDGSISEGYEFQILGTKNNLSSIINFQKHINFEGNIKRGKLKRYIDYLLSIQTCPCKQ